MTQMTQEAEVAVLQQKTTDITNTLNEIKGDVKEIKTFISSLDAHYVTRSEFTAFKKQYWLSHTMTAMITAIVTGLVFYFFKMRG